MLGSRRRTRKRRSLRHISGADVRHMTVAVKNGKVSSTLLTSRSPFALDEDNDDDEDEKDDD